MFFILIARAPGLCDNMQRQRDLFKSVSLSEPTPAGSEAQSRRSAGGGGFPPRGPRAGAAGRSAAALTRPSQPDPDRGPRIPLTKPRRNNASPAGSSQGFGRPPPPLPRADALRGVPHRAAPARARVSVYEGKGGWGGGAARRRVAARPVWLPRVAGPAGGRRGEAAAAAPLAAAGALRSCPARPAPAQPGIVPSPFNRRGSFALVPAPLPAGAGRGGGPGPLCRHLPGVRRRPAEGGRWGG